jgi:hypothetical protein
MIGKEADPVLRRIERNAIVACIVFAASAWLVAADRIDAVIGILAGGAVTGVSYSVIKLVVDGMVSALTRVGGQARGVENRTSRRVIATVMAKFVLRYALLGLIGYVMIARFRLHALGLFVGASCVVFAIALESFRVVSRSRMSS